MTPPKVLLLAGSPSDLDFVLSCQTVLDQLEIPSDIVVQSAHRTPDAVADTVRNAEKRGFAVVIAFAGMAAHLAGAAAAHTLLPVIGVPIASGPLQGVDAALASLQMPPGTPVAAVAVNGAHNGALLAARILALADPALGDRLRRLAERERERYDPDTIRAEIARRKAKRSE
jgi:phosphoribosylaminoimidazole carboxylase PurE protein